MNESPTLRLYAECISSGAITEPNGGTWMSAIALWQGSTEPLNGTWLQRHCDNLGITEPQFGSWLIALSYHYGETEPINGTWANAILIGCGAVPTDLIWDLTTTEWQLETTEWKTAAAPTVSIANQSFTDQAQPVILGTATPNVNITATLDGVTYNETSDGTGNFSITVTGGLPQAVSPGIDYTLLATPRDPQTGVEGTQVSATITSITTVVTKTITFELRTEWSLYWYYAGMQVEQETSPGTWTPIEWEGNPTWNNGSTFYKVQPFISASITAGYQTQNVMTFRSGDESGAVSTDPIFRDLILEGGFNYRIVAVNTDTPNTNVNYGRFNRYTVLEGATTILPQYDGEDVDWLSGNVQQTFTI